MTTDTKGDTATTDAEYKEVTTSEGYNYRIRVGPLDWRSEEKLRFCEADCKSKRVRISISNHKYKYDHYGAYNRKRVNRTKKCLIMGKDKSKDRDARKAGKFVKRKSGIPELEGYYFSHGEERAGASEGSTK